MILMQWVDERFLRIFVPQDTIGGSRKLFFPFFIGLRELNDGIDLNSRRHWISPSSIGGVMLLNRTVRRSLTGLLKETPSPFDNKMVRFRNPECKGAQGEVSVAGVLRSSFRISLNEGWGSVSSG